MKCLGLLLFRALICIGLFFLIIGLILTGIFYVVQSFFFAGTAILVNGFTELVYFLTSLGKNKHE